MHKRLCPQEPWPTHAERAASHRAQDVKPANIFIDDGGCLRLGDFGIARRLPTAAAAADGADGGGAGGLDMTFQVASRWYRGESMSMRASTHGARSGRRRWRPQQLRHTPHPLPPLLSPPLAAPELLFASARYGPAVDVWAAGCVIAELFELSPLAMGASDIDQVVRVMQVLGTPTDDMWPVSGCAWCACASVATACNRMLTLGRYGIDSQGLSALPDYGKLIYPVLPTLPLEMFVPNAPPAAVDLLRRLLSWDPTRRPTASEVRAT